MKPHRLGYVGVIVAAGILLALFATERGLTANRHDATSGCSDSTTDTRFGSSLRSVTNPASGNWTKVEAKWEATTGQPLCVVRVYLGSITAKMTWTKVTMLSAQPANQRVIFSFRGGDPSAVTQFEQSRPAGTQCYASYWHEPENTYQTAAQQATYRATWDQYAPAIRAGGCQSMLILMGYTSTDKLWHWEDYYNAPDIDAIGWDLYNTGWKQAGGPVYKDPTQLLAGPEAVAQSTGKPWGIAEGGSPVITTDSTGAGRVQWMAKYHAAVASSGALCAIWDDYYRPTPAPAADYTADQPMIQAWTGTGTG